MPGGAHPPPLEGFLRAGRVPGSGFGTNNGSPSEGSPGPRGSSEQQLRSRSRRPRLRQGNTCALVEGGCRQLLPGNWAQPPRSQRWGLFWSLQLHRDVQSPVRCAGAIRVPAATLCPCSVPAWWVQPSLAVPRCVWSSPCPLHGSGSGSRERLLRCLSWWGSGMGMLSQMLSNLGCFLCLGAARLWESTGGQGLATPVIPAPHSLLAGRH